MSIRRLAILTLALAASGLSARADRLHLSGGGVLEVERWWIEGQTVMYESPAGTVGLPRASVVRIEASDAPPSPPKPPRKVVSSSASAPARPRQEADTAIHQKSYVPGAGPGSGIIRHGGPTGAPHPNPLPAGERERTARAASNAAS